MIDQIGIALTGVTAIFLTQSKHEWLRRYACLFGIAGQPFWISAAFTAEQWGILLLTVLYTAAWAKGVWTHWIRPWKRRNRMDIWRQGFDNGMKIGAAREKLPIASAPASRHSTYDVS